MVHAGSKFTLSPRSEADMSDCIYRNNTLGLDTIQHCAGRLPDTHWCFAQCIPERSADGTGSH